MADDQPLLDALAMIQARGPIGDIALTDAVAHSDRFVALLPAGARTIADLGSGGGLPGLVIAWRRGDVEVTLVERRQARADLLRRAVGALGLASRTEVVSATVAEVAWRSGASFDVVTARSFGDPAATALAVSQLLVAGGSALVSEPPRNRSAEWSAALATHPELADCGVELGIRRLERRQRESPGST